MYKHKIYPKIAPTALTLGILKRVYRVNVGREENAMIEADIFAFSVRINDA